MSKKKTLEYYLSDDGLWTSDKSAYEIVYNANAYVPKNLKEKTYSVISNITHNVLVTKKTRKECATWIAKKTGKKVVIKRS